MIIITYCALFVLAGCATNPVSKSKEFSLMSEKEELALGQQLAAEYNKNLPLLPDDDPLSVYVNEVGQRLAFVSDRKELFYHFHVVDDATINAFALPGGHIYIHRGLMMYLNSEAELASVLAHEIGHVTARHAAQRYTQIQGYQLGMMVTSIFVPFNQVTGNLANLLAASFISGFGRDMELQADELALKYAPDAGYDPYATIQLLSTLQRVEHVNNLEITDTGEKPPVYHGAFATHPETRKRIQQATEKAQSMHSNGFVNHERMLAALNGYPYGDSPEEGAVVGQKFLHRDLGLQLTFPERWVIQNTPQAVTARIRNQSVYFMMAQKPLSRRVSAKEVLESLFPKRHVGEVTTGTLMGKPYARARVIASAPKVSKAAIDIIVQLDGDKALIVNMWAPRDEIDSYQSDFDAIFKSLKSYDPKIDGDIPRITIHTWHQQDSWQKLAERSGNILGKFTAERFAALNGMELNQSPETGNLIKLVK
ncbi:MAG: hypothetical protein AUJ56_11355 [Zetaproteobacteria bacterium CG1_02_49_23]|nr:MAG: hypothetical protein AUJ56_11355 [Zetaproteobacteria bacterium CG1_02_49_23]